jgi:sodium/potassium-transporting ATPase subunit alpha
MTVAHLWYDEKIVVCDTSEEQVTADFDKNSRTYSALIRVAALCNRAEFKPDQVD